LESVSEGLAAASDLTVVEPRGLGVELAGYAHLPRMLDKARATLAGTAGGYLFGCPVDHTCMARLGVSPEFVLELAGRYAGDARVFDKLREHGIPAAEDAWFDAQAVEDELQEAGYLRVRPADALPHADGGRLFAGLDHGAGVDVVLVVAGPGEGSEPHVPSTAEVWVIQEGEATFYLGAQQARVVRAGDVVRVPEGMKHRFENTARRVLRAVIAKPSAA
jgi:mannose-6-phosphate isomerase-like protein (cupin superfamily)